MLPTVVRKESPWHKNGRIKQKHDRNLIETWFDAEISRTWNILRMLTNHDIMIHHFTAFHVIIVIWPIYLYIYIYPYISIYCHCHHYHVIKMSDVRNIRHTVSLCAHLEPQVFVARACPQRGATTRGQQQRLSPKRKKAKHEKTQNITNINKHNKVFKVFSNLAKHYKTEGLANSSVEKQTLSKLFLF